MACLLHLGFIILIAFCFAADLEKSSCPSLLNAIGAQNFPLADGIYDLSLSFCNGIVCSGSQFCQTDNCCSVCQTWGGDNPGGACVGTRISVVQSTAKSMQLLIVGGDAVLDKSDPDNNGPRQALMTLNCNHSAGVLDKSVISGYAGDGNHTEGDPWTYAMTFSSYLPCLFCTKPTTCTQCTEQGCIWCLDNNQCTADRESCQSILKSPGFCPSDDCSSKYSDCQSCAAVSGCSWCQNNSSSSQCFSSSLKGMYCPGGRIDYKGFCPLSAL